MKMRSLRFLLLREADVGRDCPAVDAEVEGLV